MALDLTQPGTEGEMKQIGGQIYKFLGGYWYLVTGWDASGPVLDPYPSGTTEGEFWPGGGVTPPEEEPPPEGEPPKEGDIKTEDGILYTFTNGQWVETTYTEAIANPWAAGSPRFMEERYGRWPGFGTAMGLFGRSHLAPSEQYTAGLEPQLGALYDISGRLGTAPGMGGYSPQGMFSEWAPSYARNPFSMYAQARGMLGSAFGMTPEARSTAGVGYGSGAIDELLRSGLRTQLGKSTSGWLAGQLPSAEQSWLAQYPEQGPGTGAPSFLDYVKQKYNLGQYF